MESFLIFFLLIFTSLISIEFISVNKEISVARGFHTACIDSIENSNFDSRIITKWIEKANEYGFKLDIINLSSGVESDMLPFYYVSLNYKVNINLLGVSEESTIKGYAR